MAKKELFKIPLLAQLIKLLGAFPIDRSGGDISAIKKAISMLKNGNSVGIFPQGHRHPGVDPATTEVKNGAGLIARRAACDIVPVYIARKDHTFKLFRRTYVIIGKKIERAELEGLDNTAITKIVFDRICEMGKASESDPRVKIKRK